MKTTLPRPREKCVCCGRETDDNYHRDPRTGRHDQRPRCAPCYEREFQRAVHDHAIRNSSEA